MMVLMMNYLDSLCHMEYQEYCVCDGTGDK